MVTLHSALQYRIDRYSSSYIVQFNIIVVYVTEEKDNPGRHFESKEWKISVS
jgi:hypothetical protein